MRRYGWMVAITALLLAAGFAAASIASGGGLGALKKTGTTSTVPKKQVLCHHTHSKKNPTVTITVSSSAVPAHLKHGDTLGACPQSQSATKKKKNSSNTNSATHGNSGSPHGNSANAPGKNK
jgi:hypothetical protein